MAEPFKRNKGTFVSDSSRFGEPLSTPKNNVPKNEYKRSIYKRFKNRKDNAYSFKEASYTSSDDQFIRHYQVDPSGSFENDKVAHRNTTTTAGDGGTFSFKYSKSGILKGKLKLSRGSERISADDVTGRIREDFEYAESFKDGYDAFVKPPDTDNIYTDIDDRFLAATNYFSRKSYRDYRRYRDIDRTSSKEIKQLKKDIKNDESLSAGTLRSRSGFGSPEVSESNILADKFDSAEAIHDTYFNKSKITFSDDKAVSSRFIDSKFQSKTANIEEKFEYQPEVKQDRYQFTDGYSNPDKETNAGRQPAGVSYEKVSSTDEGKKSNFVEQNKSSAQSREMTKRDDLEQKKAERKAAKKGKNKQVRKMAVTTAVSKAIETKKILSKDVVSSVTSDELTGDLLKDGNSGLTKVVTNAPVNAAKRLAAKAAKATVKITAQLAKGLVLSIIKILGIILSSLMTLLVPLIALLLPLVLGVVFIVYAVSSAIGGGTVDEGASGDLYEYSVGYDYTSYVSAPMDIMDIEETLQKALMGFPYVTSEQEDMLRYCLTVVGSPYSQSSHWDHTDNVYDCSELAYIAALSQGVEMIHDDLFSAAAECQFCDENGYSLEGTVYLRPGDFIFYGGRDNNRYKGIYHVSIYLGNIDGVDYMVEAYDESLGVIKSKLRTENIVTVARIFPYEP